MISTFTAFIDANVFYGMRLRSLMPFCAQTKLFRARWSDAVHDEWISNLLRNRPDLKWDDLEKTRNAMNRAVPDCLVTGYEPLMDGIDLPDPDDRHVVAAAVLTGANVIVTFNQKDFPAETLEPLRLHTRHPDHFLVDIYEIAPSVLLGAVASDFRHYITPALSFDDYLNGLARAGVPNFAERLRPLEVLITR